MIYRKRAPKEITASDGEIIDSSGRASSITPTAHAPMHPSDSKTPVRTPLRARSGCCAPQFCATKVVEACPIAVVGTIRNASMRLYAAQPDALRSPRSLMYPCTNMFEKEVKPCWMLAGSPISRISFSARPSMCSLFHRSPKDAFSFVSAYSTSTALAACAIIVAYATPATPMWKQMTNSRSSAVLTTAEKTRKYSGRRESPTARRIALPML